MHVRFRRPARRSTPVAVTSVAAAALAIGAVLAGCTSPPADPVPATTPAARPTPAEASSPDPVPTRPVASDPVELGSGEVTVPGIDDPVGTLTFTDLGAAGIDIRLTGLDEVPGAISLVLLDEYEPKRGCLPDVFHMSAWQPDLEPDGAGAHSVHVDRYRDASGDRGEFPHAMMMVADSSGADFDDQVASGCLFPVVAESEVTWSRVTR
ncbi:hypothetical protein ABID70_002221 [Clavibacter michiganensis]|uniref:hypothetical protein n=1 Tax=Clavibacter michiganensis TaxID=28447 RepID=UPI001AE6ABA6|nr:hypothetical protein [Clavibacter michiganensis]MBP2456697.1 hypothetical protein [Clavibacter michiganensis]MDQ0409267.1 hypothetical protein [Clavibacter michiganensis]